MSLEDTINRINKNRLHSSYLAGVQGNSRNTIPTFLDIAKKHFDALEKDEEVVATEEDLFNAMKVLDLCKMIVVEIPITDELKELVNDLCMLVYNWNKNLEDSEVLTRDIKFLRNAIEMHFCLIDLVKFTKIVMRQAERKHMSSAERTDEISRHFLHAIDALQEGCDCEEKDICS